MPKMPGLQLVDKQVKQALSPHEKEGIAYALGENLQEVQHVKWGESGKYDLKLDTVKPFENNFADWLVNDTFGLLESSYSYNNGTTQVDIKWATGLIEECKAALEVAFTPTLVLHDYKEGNMTVEQKNGEWKVSGLFDLMESLFGDGELDVVRQLAAYSEESELTNALAFLAGFTRNNPLREKANERLHLFMLYDRLVIWDYFHRPNHVSQMWQPEDSLQTWVSGYFEKLEKLM